MCSLKLLFQERDSRLIFGEILICSVSCEFNFIHGREYEYLQNILKRV